MVRSSHEQEKYMTYFIATADRTNKALMFFRLEAEFTTDSVYKLCASNDGNFLTYSDADIPVLKRPCTGGDGFLGGSVRTAVATALEKLPAGAAITVHPDVFDVYLPNGQEWDGTRTADVLGIFESIYRES
jgi:hypothetical protein